jgi:hypothetical protein
MPARVRVDKGRGTDRARAEALAHNIDGSLDRSVSFDALVRDTHIVADRKHRLLDLGGVAELRTRNAEQPNAAGNIEVVQQLTRGRQDLDAQVRRVRKGPGPCARLEVGEPHLQGDCSGRKLLATDARTHSIGQPHQLAIARGTCAKVGAKRFFGADRLRVVLGDHDAGILVAGERREMRTQRIAQRPNEHARIDLGNIANGA